MRCFLATLSFLPGFGGEGKRSASRFRRLAAQAEDSALSGWVGWYTLRRIVFSFSVKRAGAASRLCRLRVAKRNWGASPTWRLATVLGILRAS